MRERSEVKCNALNYGDGRRSSSSTSHSFYSVDQPIRNNTRKQHTSEKETLRVVKMHFHIILRLLFLNKRIENWEYNFFFFDLCVFFLPSPVYDDDEVHVVVYIQNFFSCLFLTLRFIFYCDYTVFPHPRWLSLVLTTSSRFRQLITSPTDFFRLFEWLTWVRAARRVVVIIVVTHSYEKSFVVEFHNFFDSHAEERRGSE